jgi:uncharacterized membrane protein YkgB
MRGGRARPLADSEELRLEVAGGLSARKRRKSEYRQVKRAATSSNKETTMMTHLLRNVAKSDLLKRDIDYHLIRASMVIIFLLFGYQKWFAYEAQALIPYISNGPLISWLYPVFGVPGGSLFLGVMEWLFCLLLFWGFWNRPAGILGALGSCATFVTTVTIIPFMPNGWDEIAGAFPQ